MCRCFALQKIDLPTEKGEMRMDYKDVCELLGWVSENVKISGTDARVLIFMSTKANYKTGKIQISYSDIAACLGISVSGIVRAIERLEKVGILVVESQRVGRASAWYRLRPAGDLRILHESEKINAQYHKWFELRESLFAGFERTLRGIGKGCPDCKDADNLCPSHEAMRERLMDSPDGRKMRLWDRDNPKPPSRIKVVCRIDPGAKNG